VVNKEVSLSSSDPKASRFFMKVVDLTNSTLRRPIRFSVA